MIYKAPGNSAEKQSVSQLKHMPHEVPKRDTVYK